MSELAESDTSTDDTINNDVDEQAAKSTDGDDQKQAVIDKASSMGHQSKDDWVTNGGDPLLWQPPEVFLQLKPALSKLKDQGKQIKNLKRENETLNTVYGHQVENLRSQLKIQHDEAVSEADVTKVNQIQDQLDNLPAIDATAPRQALSETLETWNADPKNDWYKKDPAKQAFADRRFGQYKEQNYSDSDSIRLMEDDIKRHFVDVNVNRSNASRSEAGSKPGNKQAARKLTLNDLTSTEASIWRHRPPNMWKDESEFLAMVTKTRDDDND